MAERKPLIVGNWKMFHGGASGCELAVELRRSLADIDKVDLVVAPPFTALAAVAHELDGSRIQVAAQNTHFEASGAYTGEVSCQMLLEAGCSWTLVGHSERRQHFSDTDESVGLKVKSALAAGLLPIACVGETLEQREAGTTLDVVHRQVDAIIDAIGESSAEPGLTTIAYEPIWAIGTGKVAGPEQAQEVHAAIRARLARDSTQLSEITRILYGGSVKPGNSASLMACTDIDGALVGGASLNAESFANIARSSG